MDTALLKSQKNHVFMLIKEVGFSPLEFEWGETNGRWDSNADGSVEELTHVSTGFYFVFDRRGRSANPRFFPGDDRKAEFDCGRVASSEDVSFELRHWLSIVKNEIDEPDLWLLAKEDKKLIAANIDDLENAPFTASEQQRIGTAITEIHAFLKVSGEHSHADLEFIQSRLNHLAEASSRLGRKDWITLAMGTLTNIALGVALAPEAARELVRTAGALLGWVVGHVPLLP